MAVEMESLLIGSFLAGLLMFLAPCTLPLVPAFIAFLGGNTISAQKNRLTVLRNAFLFTSGFTLIFVLFGLLAGLLGTSFGPYRSFLVQVSGGLIIVFGLTLLGLFDIPLLNRTFTPQVPKFFTVGTGRSAFITGALVAVGWSPCVGPLLATVLLLTASTATALSGTILLFVFSLGFSIPFLLVAVLYSRVNQIPKSLLLVSRVLRYVGGALIVVIGYLLLTDSLGMLTSMTESFFELFGLSSLLNFY